MSEIEIKNLNNLKRNSHLGLYKKGLALSTDRYYLVCAYLEKINYSIQDIEKELKKNSDNSILISILVYVCWIQESVQEIQKSYQKYATEHLIYDTDVLDKDKKFLNAIRSFIFAHPLTTNRHELFGFDGTLRCVDIRPNGSDMTSCFWKEEDKNYLDENGLNPYKDQSVDYWLYIYNDEKYDNQFNQYIGVSLKTICSIANDYIEYIYALDKHLSKVKIQKCNNDKSNQ